MSNEQHRRDSHAETRNTHSEPDDTAIHPTHEKPDVSDTPPQVPIRTIRARIQHFWAEHVSVEYVVVDQVFQDHLANERTFHQYLALALSISIVGMVILQTSRIQHVLRPLHDNCNILRYNVFGIPQAAACQTLAILFTLIGTYRFFREQSAIQHGTLRAGQWSLLCVGALIFILLLSMLVMLFAVDITKTLRQSY